MRRRSYAFRAAWAGVVHTVATQPNFRIEIGIGAAAVAAALWLRAPLVPIVTACALVLALELLNTAVEATIDLLSPTQRDAARVAKDCAAGAVLIAAAYAVAVGVLVLGPPLMGRLGVG